MSQNNEPTEETKPKLSLADEIRRRCSLTKKTRWIRFALVSLVFVAWVAWMQSWWLLIFWFLLFDIYITGFIPLTWWKKSKNSTVRAVMSWVDAIVYALVLVYFVFAFVGQNYQIPSSSLEKTLLTGDYLWVNKAVYGPRVPMTPVHFPLVHNKFFGVNSYLDSPSLPYKRLKGLRNVELGDIVVFNFPAGDTVLTKYEDVRAEYYDMLVEDHGREFIQNNPQEYGRKVFRPVDRRQNYVKRAVGLPGQRFKIVNDTIFIDGQAQPFPENVQFDYLFTTARTLTQDDLHELGITPSDFNFITPAQPNYYEWASLLPAVQPNATIYLAPLTAGMRSRLENEFGMDAIVKLNELGRMTRYIFPYSSAGDWTISNFGGDDGILIPAKGTTIELNADSWKRYHRIIRNYEGHTDAHLDEATGIVYMDGAPASEYTFGMDYYFMMGDNRDRSQDSRYWGFVPEDHIVGTPMVVLVSFDSERGLFDGKIRWSRIFRDANPDK